MLQPVILCSPNPTIQLIKSDLRKWMSLFFPDFFIWRKWLASLSKRKILSNWWTVASWCIDYHYCKTLNPAWSQVLTLIQILLGFFRSVAILRTSDNDPDFYWSAIYHKQFIIKIIWGILIKFSTLGTCFTEGATD